MQSSEPPLLQELILKYRLFARTLAAFVTALLLFSSLTAAASIYPELPSCVRPGDHTVHANTSAFSMGKVCCDMCAPCTDYFNAHLQGLSLTIAYAWFRTPHAPLTSLSIYATDFISSPVPPPPKSVG